MKVGRTLAICLHATRYTFPPRLSGNLHETLLYQEIITDRRHTHGERSAHLTDDVFSCPRRKLVQTDEQTDRQRTLDRHLTASDAATLNVIGLEWLDGSGVHRQRAAQSEPR